MPSELFDWIEDFRFDNRLPSFSAAIEELVRRGLEHDAELRRKLREEAVMDDLDAWVAERQAELDALLRDQPDLYMEARRRFQQEYERLKAKLEAGTNGTSAT